MLYTEWENTSELLVYTSADSTVIQAAVTSDGLYLVTLTQQVLLSLPLSPHWLHQEPTLFPSVHTVCVAAVCDGGGGRVGWEGEDGERILTLQPQGPTRQPALCHLVQSGTGLVWALLFRL